MHDTIKKLRATLPPLLTLRQYCAVRNCCEASAYRDLRAKPGLGVKVGYSTRIVRDVMLDEMARLPAWTPLKDRKKPRRDKQRAAPRRRRDLEVRDEAS